MSGREHKPGHGGAGQASQAQGAESDPRMAQAHAFLRQANAFNSAHPELVAEFNKLTQGKCAGNGAGGVSVMLVRKWQLGHGMKGDGKIGKSTVDAAKAEAPAGNPEAQGGGDSDGKGDHKQAAAPGGGGGGDDAGGAEVMGNPNLLDNITGGAVGEEKREKKTTGEALEDTGGGIQDAGEGLHHGAGIEEQPWLKAAMAPAIVQLLREGDYMGAVKAMAKSFSPSEYIEGLTMAAEKLGLHGAVKALGKLAAVGAELNVSLEMVMWTYEGLMAIAEAHEKGDRDSRITIYAGAFADGFLYGENAPGNPGAVTAEQKEAAERGRKDGVTTAGRTGELAPAIGKELMRRYGTEKNARHAIMDELLRKGGFTGIKTHEGK